MHLPRVWADIDLQQVALNVQACRRMLPEQCAILGVVKANAYGHEARSIAVALERNGVAMLGVGDSNEAIELRQNGIAAPILVLGAVVEGEIPELIRHQITPMIHSPERIVLFNRAARRLGVRLPVHLLVDTGEARLGVTPARALQHMQAIQRAPHLELRGIGTHFASPVEDRAYTLEQIARFQRLLDKAKDARIRLPFIHAANSGALTRYPEAHFNMARIGGYLYGLAPDALPQGIEPVLSLYTQIVYLRDHPTGTSIGYGGTFKTRRPSRIATLPVGYHDGFAHHLSNRAEVLLRGRRAPVVGRVTMDYVMVDVTEIPGASVGDRVTLIGRDGSEAIHVRELSERAGTIPYEIPCRLGNRVSRFHRLPEEPAAPIRRTVAVALETSRTA